MKKESLQSKGVVLLVETDRVLVDLVKLSLNRTGFTVRTTDNPSEISTLIDEIHPQIILLDLFIPGWNGLEILERMKEMGFLNDCRVIVMTSFGFMEVLQQAILLGAVDFIVKPFDIDILVNKVNKYLYW